ncbi:hypothetical protein QR680_001328 [Steinernema hermaphroditum]|uniref:G-protein coupled receptors family 1 profile domain-containing protein n=1 Tax=Steinernema hermaphroditum TaxID=289476 RepID=A0AA39LF76_9BILA|nr:hypothetical protein QR680_001328 [Steinernema hermaphroditum]
MNFLTQCAWNLNDTKCYRARRNEITGVNMEQPNDVKAYRAKMYEIVIPIFLILSCFAIFANVIVILALRGTKVISPTVILIASLTISDIWTSAIVAASLLYNSYLPAVKDTEVNPCASLTLEMMRTGGLITGALHLLLIAIHHYIGILSPWSSRAPLNRPALALCLLAWATPLVALFGVACSINGQGYRNCSDVRFYHTRLFRFSVSILLVVIFLLISWFYIRLLCMLNTLNHKWQSTTAHRRVSRQNRTLLTAILICSNFFIGWAPATIHFMITCETCRLLNFVNRQEFSVLFALSCIQLSFIIGKSIMNPLIYSLRIPEVDTQIRALAERVRSLLTPLCRFARNQNSGELLRKGAHSVSIKCDDNAENKAVL